MTAVESLALERKRANNRAYTKARYDADPEKERARVRAWRLANIEKALAKERTYRIKYPERVRETRRAYRAANLEEERARCRAWRKANPDKSLSYDRAYYVAHAEQRRAESRAYAIANPGKVLALCHNRRARLKGTGGKHTAADVQAQYKRQRGKCYWCKVKLGKKYHIDHVIPIAKGGGNDRNNIVVACGPCNMHKSDRMPADFAGRLL